MSKEKVQASVSKIGKEFAVILKTFETNGAEITPAQRLNAFTHLRKLLDAAEAKASAAHAIALLFSGDFDIDAAAAPVSPSPIVAAKPLHPVHQASVFAPVDQLLPFIVGVAPAPVSAPVEHEAGIAYDAGGNRVGRMSKEAQGKTAILGAPVAAEEVKELDHADGGFGFLGEEVKNG